jgi:hypothetical protein
VTRAASPEARAVRLLAVAVAVIAAVGGLLRLRTDLHLGVIPFHGGLGFGAGPGTPAAVALGTVLVVALPVLAARLRIAALAAVAWAATAAWAVAVATQQAWSDLSYPLRTRWDYWQALPAARQLGPQQLLATYVERLGSYPVHVQGHPPGMVVMLWALDAAGLHGTGWAAAAIVAVGATTPAGVLLAVHWWGAEDAARQALPFLVLSPAVLFVATVGDGVFAAAASWTIALLVLATRRRGRAAVVAAGVAGALGALGLHLTYGLVPLLVTVGAVAVGRARRPGLLVPVAAGAAAVTVPFLAAGFRWWDGLSATRHWYAVGAAAERPYAFFVVANLIAFALMLGPAVVAALARRLPADVAALVGAGIAAVAVSDLSGLSKGEVERIWLPMLPWVTLAVAGLVRRSSPSQLRRWLGAGAAFTLVLQILVAWPW